jgi:hypothetical protein
MAQPIARHHAEWLSLVEVSGPLLTLPVLQRAFPQGLEDTHPELAASLAEDRNTGPWRPRVVRRHGVDARVGRSPHDGCEADMFRASDLPILQDLAAFKLACRLGRPKVDGGWSGWGR